MYWYLLLQFKWRYRRRDSGLNAIGFGDGFVYQIFKTSVDNGAGCCVPPNSSWNVSNAFWKDISCFAVSLETITNKILRIVRQGFLSSQVFWILCRLKCRRFQLCSGSSRGSHCLRWITFCITDRTYNCPGQVLTFLKDDYWKRVM